MSWLLVAFSRCLRKPCGSGVDELFLADDEDLSGDSDQDSAKPKKARSLKRG